ncbi:MAG: sulfatase-like hydrolase/transferase [Candidatus Eiseniibacteriota bacterium]
MSRARRAVAAALLLGTLSGCADAPSDGGAGGTGVLLVTVDTFRADRAGCMGHPGGLTPELDRVARLGLLCREAFAPAPLTAVSHATILTGVDPPRHGVRQNTSYVVPDSLPSLAARLRDEGFRTGAVIAALPLTAQFGFGHGFEHFDDDLAGDSASPFYAERPARVVVDHALAWVDGLAAADRWFLWAHFFDPHYPYEAPRPLNRLPAGDPYDREIRTADREIGKLLDGIEARRGTRPWIFVLSDHGEGLGGHGETSHGVLVYAETMQGFFALSGPGAAAGRVGPGMLGGLVRYTDVFPTLLDALGLEEEPAGTDGRSLLAAAADGRGAYGESYYSALTFRWSPVLSWRDERWTYIESSVPELYDRWSDPGEERDVSAANPDVAARFAASLAAVTVDPGDPAAEVDPEVVEQLLALGYVAGTRAFELDRTKNPRERIGAVNDLFRGIALMGLGKTAEALSAFQRAYRADPDNSSVLFHLADCLHTLGDSPSAIEYYRRSVAADSRQGQAWAHLAVLEFDRGRRSEGMAALEEGLRINPTAFPLLMTAGDLHAELGETEEADGFYRLAAEKYPDREEPRAKLAGLAGRRGEAGAARGSGDGR